MKAVTLIHTIHTVQRPRPPRPYNTGARDLSPLTAANPYLSAAIISGNTVYLSGLTGQTPDGKFVPGTIQDRTRQIIRNAQAQLEHIGLGLSDREL